MFRRCVQVAYAALVYLALSALLCFANAYPDVEMCIKSVPTDWNITLTWSVPETMKADRVVLVRKKNGFPVSVGDGKVVYTGYGGSTEDNHLVADTQYYYRFFLLDAKGEITGWARHKEKT